MNNETGDIENIIKRRSQWKVSKLLACWNSGTESVCIEFNLGLVNMANDDSTIFSAWKCKPTRQMSFAIYGECKKHVYWWDQGYTADESQQGE